jgi:Holliday junction resolvase RusA-like endonuclease
MVQIQLDGIPVISKKNRLKFARGRTYKDKVVADFEAELGKAAAEVVAQLPDFSAWTCPVKMKVVVQVPDKRRRDLQNMLDTICDSLNDIVYYDDVQIVSIDAKKQFGKSWSLYISVEPA